MNRAIPIIEAAYRWVADDAAWLRAVVDAAGSYQVGGGLVGYVVDLKERPHVTAIESLSGTAPEHADALFALTQAFSPKIARRMYVPTEFPGNAAHRLARVMQKSRVEPADFQQRTGHALPPLWAVVSGHPQRKVVVLAYVAPGPTTAEQPFPSRDHARQLGLVGAHLGAALRLRARVGHPSADDPETEAVLSPNGKLLHASDDAVAERQSLAEAVLTIERVRRRKLADAEALEAWNALVEGKWSIVDIVESDGKRLMLARRNPLDGHDLMALTPLERDVAWLTALGHSYKYIAYELGIDISSVVRRLRTVLGKLRLRTRGELVRAFALAEEAGAGQ